MSTRKDERRLWTHLDGNNNSRVLGVPYLFEGKREEPGFRVERELAWRGQMFHLFHRIVGEDKKPTGSIGGWQWICSSQACLGAGHMERAATAPEGLKTEILERDETTWRGGRERARGIRERRGRRAKMKEESNEQNDGIKARNPQCACDRINDQAEFKQLVNSEFTTRRATKSAASAYTMPFRLSARLFIGKSLSFNIQWESKVKLDQKLHRANFQKSNWEMNTKDRR
ncbi:hypothetical protein DFH07DRAFT_764000 [Mycena maculata]|uniref:Uncharacterized protein n=1 Tax=Mycena maculata TaxID=230809 RepID=A0AAD7KDI4_9AGAR|nr:hypothetical protein DFH07DRAFT_764000 [Mycena maculata]